MTNLPADIPPGWLQLTLALTSLIGVIVAAIIGAFNLRFSQKIKEDVNSNWTAAQKQLEDQKVELEGLRSAVAGMVGKNTPAEQLIANQVGLDALSMVVKPAVPESPKV